MRISTPCRSIQCVHAQCFDAMSWYSVMEQTTTWLCPVCEKVLNTEDLIVDGYVTFTIFPEAFQALMRQSRYFDEILKNTHEDVEDVIVEADGQWHTSDNKYGSASWKATHPPVKPPSPVKSASPPKRRSISPTKHVTNGTNGQSRLSTAEIVILDSDDEDEGRVKRELSPSTEPAPSANSSFTSTLPPRSQTQETDVIDLTLDSDEDDDSDEESMSELPLAKKRKVGTENDVLSPTEPIWKKSRTDGPGASSSPGSSGGSGYARARHPSQNRTPLSRTPTMPAFSSAPGAYGSYNGRSPNAFAAFSSGVGPASLPRRPDFNQGPPSYLGPVGNPFIASRMNGAGRGSSSSSSPEAWRS